MPGPSRDPSAVTLSPEPAARWTLHHVLLDRLERDAAAGQADADSPPTAAFEAFETLDAGGTAFTVAEAEAIRTVLADAHHSRTWEHERARLERLLRDVTDRLERTGAAEA